MLIRLTIQKKLEQAGSFVDLFYIHLENLEEPTGFSVSRCGEGDCLQKG